MRIMIHRGSTGKVLLTRGPLFYQTERSRAAISLSATKQRFKLCRRDFICSYLRVYRSSRVRVHGVKMWGDGGWRCIERTAPRRDVKTQISWIWETEEVVRHCSCTLRSAGSTVMSFSRQTSKDILSWGNSYDIHFTGTLYIDFTLRVSNMWPSGQNWPTTWLCKHENCSEAINSYDFSIRYTIFTVRWI